MVIPSSWSADFPAGHLHICLLILFAILFSRDRRHKPSRFRHDHTTAHSSPPQLYVWPPPPRAQPRDPYPSEKTYITTNPDGTISTPAGSLLARPALARRAHLSTAAAAAAADFPIPRTTPSEPAEVAMSVVIPAYNEEARIVPALEDSGRLPRRALRPPAAPPPLRRAPLAPFAPSRASTPASRPRPPTVSSSRARSASASAPPPTRYEILIVNDGSRDRTVAVAPSTLRGGAGCTTCCAS